MTPATAKRREDIVSGGACRTMMRAEVNALDQMRANVRPIKIARISMFRVLD